jgi:hypothetical protein
MTVQDLVDCRLRVDAWQRVAGVLPMLEPLGASTVEEDPIIYDKAEYIETTTGLPSVPMDSARHITCAANAGNKVSRRSVLCGSQHIVFTGKVLPKHRTVAAFSTARLFWSHRRSSSLGSLCAVIWQTCESDGIASSKRTQ